MNFRFILLFLVIVSVRLIGQEPASLDKLAFDKTRYIDVDELKRGMTGYGLTVFNGTKIEKFQVEIVSVMTAKSAGRSAFLIKVVGEPRFDIAKGVHGCSGSPVFFNDRLAGAMAFGWTFQEEPLYGVTPISQMLNSYKRVLASELATKEKKQAREKLLEPEVYSRLLAPEVLQPKDWERIARAMSFGSNQLNTGPAGSKPLLASLGVSGLAPGALSSLEKYMPGFSVDTMAFSADIDSLLTDGRPKLERGSTIVIPLVSGDIEATALGTVTEVIDDWVFAFGHSFNGNGPCDWPMATGYIHTFVSGVESSFKLGQTVDVVGAVQADELIAICGRIGAESKMAPAKTIVNYESVGETVEFNMQLVREESYAPSVAAVAVTGPAQYRGAMPDLCTIEYQVSLDFGNYGQILISDISSEYATNDLTVDISTATSLMVSSPWDDVKLEKMESKIRVNDKSIAGNIEKADIAKVRYEPGETINADIELFRYRDEPVKLKASMTLPEGLEPGQYILLVSGKNGYLDMLDSVQPFRGMVDNTADIVKVLELRHKYKRNNVFMALVNDKNNLAIEQEPLGDIPASKAMLLTSSARQLPTTEYNDVIEAVTPCDFVIFGQKEFTIEVTPKKSIATIK